MATLYVNVGIYTIDGSCGMMIRSWNYGFLGHSEVARIFYFAFCGCCGGAVCNRFDNGCFF